jgi:hypothetical protein
MRDRSEEFLVHLARSAGTVRMNCRQSLNADNRGPSGFIAFWSRSLRSSQPLWRLPQFIGLVPARQTGRTNHLDPHRTESLSLLAPAPGEES